MKVQKNKIPKFLKEEKQILPADEQEFSFHYILYVSIYTTHLISYLINK